MGRQHAAIPDGHAAVMLDVVRSAVGPVLDFLQRSREREVDVRQQQLDAGAMYGIPFDDRAIETIGAGAVMRAGCGAPVVEAQSDVGRMDRRKLHQREVLPFDGRLARPRRSDRPFHLALLEQLPSLPRELVSGLVIVGLVRPHVLPRRFPSSCQPLTTISGRSCGDAGLGRGRSLELFWKSRRPSVDDWRTDASSNILR